MGPILNQSFNNWVESLSETDVEAILRAYYENEHQHLLDMEADAQVQEELDGRA